MNYPDDDTFPLTEKEVKAIKVVLDMLVRLQAPKPQPQLAPSLREAVESVLSDPLKRYFPLTSNVIKYLTDALTAERKRQGLVDNLIDAVRRFYQENDGRYDLLRVRLSELDAHDKEVRNG